MKNTSLLLFGISLIAITWGACQKEATRPSGSNSVGNTLALPLTKYKYNQSVVNRSLTRPDINSNKANLGRVLFYDASLSVSNTVACASCHNQANAFSDVTALSSGFTGEATARNSMALFNLTSNGQYFWDMRKEGLSSMVLDPAIHLVEMGMESREKIGFKLAEIPYYQELFGDVYSTQEITPDRIEECLAEFLLSIVSGSSKFDEVNNNTAQFTAQEQRGFTIFQESQCFNCHSGSNFNNLTLVPTGHGFISKGGGWSGGPINNTSINSTADFANIGLEYDYPDPGISPDIQSKMGLTEIEQGMFKIPSLRNVGLTAPYMHDGRFATLMDVVNHYDHGVKRHNNLDLRIQNRTFDPNTGVQTSDGSPRRLNLSQQDKEDLVAFLHTLSDMRLITDPKYSNPFH